MRHKGLHNEKVYVTISVWVLGNDATVHFIVYATLMAVIIEKN